MKTIIILRAGQFGQACAHLINTRDTKLLAFGDNNSSLWGSYPGTTPILSVEKAAVLKPDYALIAVTDEERTSQLRDQAQKAGFTGIFLFLGQLCRRFDIRSATLCRIAHRLREQNIPGDTAAGLEDCRFVLVSLDADLYAPILAGLEYFYPRLSPGGMILPLTDLSFALGRKLGLKPETLPHVLLENGVATLFFNTAATLVLTGVNIFHNPAIEGAVAAGALPSVSAVFWSSVIHDWPIMFVISYIFAFFVTKLAIKIATASVGDLKTAQSPQNRH